MRSLSQGDRQAIAGSKTDIASGRLRLPQAAIEEFELDPGEKPSDLAFALRVGAFDGRHPEIEQAALSRVRRALRRGARLFIDGGDPLQGAPAWLRRTSIAAGGLGSARHLE